MWEETTRRRYILMFFSRPATIKTNCRNHVFFFAVSGCLRVCIARHHRQRHQQQAQQRQTKTTKAITVHSTRTVSKRTRPSNFSASKVHQRLPTRTYRNQGGQGAIRRSSGIQQRFCFAGSRKNKLTICLHCDRRFGDHGAQE